ncbi:MAG: hypothetical protein ACR2NM_05310 [Bythopirellula sp.]
MKEKNEKQLLALVLRSQAERVAGKKVSEIVQATRHELSLTDIAYDRLMAGIELGKRIAESKAEYSEKITSTHEAIAFCKSHFARLIAEGLQHRLQFGRLVRC